MDCDFISGVNAIRNKQLPVACVDTCVWLDFFRGRVPSSEIRTNMRLMSQLMGTNFIVVMPEQVKKEYIRNKAGVSAGFVSALKQASAAVDKFMEDFRELCDPRQLSLRGNFEQHIVNRYVKFVDDAIANSIVYKVELSHYAKGALRSCTCLAPAAEKQGRSTADCVILESFLSFVQELRSQGYNEHAYFLTSNTADFSDSQKPDEVHADLRVEFSQLGISYESVLPRFLNRNSF